MFYVMQQRWHEISFFHWRSEPELLQKRLPRQLEIDRFDGTAWVSLTPFLLQGLRPAWVPRSLGLDFPETNLRTYVRGPRGPGIWFFSLDAARFSAVLGARALYGLPYYKARMSVGIAPRHNSYSSERSGRARVSIRVEKGQSVVPSELDCFLTERYRLYSVFGPMLVTAEVSHLPWQLNRIAVLEFEEALREAAGLPCGDPPLLHHHSAGVDTRIGPPVPCGQAG